MSDNSIHRIKDKRLSKDGNQEFLIDYKNSDKKPEEWKTVEDIPDFERLNKLFNNQLNQKTTNSLTNGTNGLSNGTNVTHEEGVQPVEKSPQKLNGFDRGFRPFKILGAKNDEQNGLMFLVMFREDMRSADLIPNHILHQKCPQLLIKFYEKNTLWKRY